MKRTFLFIGVLSLALVTLWPCWSGGQADASKGQQATGLDFQGKTVNVMVMAAPIVSNFQALLSDFEVRTGAKVNYVIISPKNYDEKAGMELMSPKGAYDVVWIPWRTFHLWTKAAWFEPLDAYLADKKVVEPELLEKDGFAPRAYQSMAVDGKQFALPIMAGTAILHYRKDVLAKHGIKAPPDTWAELEQVAKKIHSRELAAVGMRGSRQAGNIGLHYPMILAANGGSIVKKYPEDMHPTLDEPTAIESAEYFCRILREYGFPGVLTASWQENVVAFQQGKLALYPDENVLTGQLMDPAKSTVVADTGIALIPKGRKARVSFSPVHGLGVPKNSPQKVLGYKFIEWALSEEVQFKNCLTNEAPAIVRPALMLRKEYVDKYGWGEGQWAKVVSETFSKYSDPLYRPMTPEWPRVEELLAIAISGVLTGQAEVGKALAEANKEIYRVYQEAGYYTK